MMNMNKPKPDILKFLARFAIGALIVMVLMSAFSYCWMRWHLETDKVRTSRCELQEVEWRMELSRIYYEDELARLRPPVPNTTMIEDGAK
jgi:hypothetical protein